MSGSPGAVLGGPGGYIFYFTYFLYDITPVSGPVSVSGVGIPQSHSYLW